MRCLTTVWTRRKLEGENEVEEEGMDEDVDRKAIAGAVHCEPW